MSASRPPSPESVSKQFFHLENSCLNQVLTFTVVVKLLDMLQADDMAEAKAKRHSHKATIGNY
jgi:hypothetical protein